MIPRFALLEGLGRVAPASAKSGRDARTSGALLAPIVPAGPGFLVDPESHAVESLFERFAVLMCGRVPL